MPISAGHKPGGGGGSYSASALNRHIPPCIEVGHCQSCTRRLPRGKSVGNQPASCGPAGKPVHFRLWGARMEATALVAWLEEIDDPRMRWRHRRHGRRPAGGQGQPTRSGPPQAGLTVEITSQAQPVPSPADGRRGRRCSRNSSASGCSPKRFEQRGLGNEITGINLCRISATALAAATKRLLRRRNLRQSANCGARFSICACLHSCKSAESRAVEFQVATKLRPSATEWSRL